MVALWRGGRAHAGGGEEVDMEQQRTNKVDHEGTTAMPRASLKWIGRDRRSDRPTRPP